MKKIFSKIKKILNRSIDNELTYLELKNIMENNKNAKLIDVRSIQEFNEGHLNNAINLPVYDLAKKIEANVQNKNDIIILYCQSETRSIKAKKILEKMGYTNLYVLKDGLDGIK